MEWLRVHLLRNVQLNAFKFSQMLFHCASEKRVRGFSCWAKNCSFSTRSYNCRENKKAHKNVTLLQLGQALRL